MTLDQIMELVYPRADLALLSDDEVAKTIGVTTPEITAARKEISRRIAIIEQRAAIAKINEAAIAKIDAVFTDAALAVPTLGDFKAFVQAQ